MHLLLLLGGAALVALLLFDVFRTTMLSGGGPVTRFVTRGCFFGLHSLYRSRKSRRILAWGGSAAVLLTVTAWIVLLWIGWLLVFSAFPQAVLNASTRAPAGLFERIYFVGFTLSTLGTGDFQPHGAPWQVLTAAVSFTGLFLVTFAIAYLVPVVQAAAEKRALSVRIASLGQAAPDLLLNTCEEEDGELKCSALASHLTSLTGDLALLEQRHLTYPVLHFLHSMKRPEGMALSIATLDEALTILSYGLREESDLPHGVAYPVRQMMTEFLETLREVHIKKADAPPPPPSLEPLREAGLPMVSDEVFRERLGELGERRKLLRALVESDGWTWDLVRRADYERTATASLEDKKPLRRGI